MYVSIIESQFKKLAGVTNKLAYYNDLEAIEIPVLPTLTAATDGYFIVVPIPPKSTRTLNLKIQLSHDGANDATFRVDEVDNAGVVGTALRTRDANGDVVDSDIKDISLACNRNSYSPFQDTCPSLPRTPEDKYA